MLIPRYSQRPIRKGVTYGTKSVFLGDVMPSTHIIMLNHLNTHISLSYPNESCRRITKRESNVKQVQLQCVVLSICLNITMVGYLLHLFTRARARIRSLERPNR